MNEILFGGWSLFVIFAIPVLLILNAGITFSSALWIKNHPRNPIRKYLTVFLVLLIIGIIYLAINDISTLNDPNFASKRIAQQAVLEGWLRWIMLIIMFGMIPYGGTSLVLWYITRPDNSVSRKHFLIILPATNAIITIFSSIIYIALAIGLDATPD
ncbi:MAG: hypothetical protein HY779_06260 [Rubrobacteridae bacterium]|nr:hypothetical protein [Rubrobacteridae bacterium]